MKLEYKFADCTMTVKFPENIMDLIDKNTSYRIEWRWGFQDETGAVLMDSAGKVICDLETEYTESIK